MGDGRPETAESSNARTARWVMAVVSIVTLLGYGAVMLAVEVYQLYGWGLFVGVPIGVGFLAGILGAMQGPSGLRATLVMAALSPVGVFAALLLTGVEGLVCLVMAAPLWFPLCVIGGIGAWLVGRTMTRSIERLVAAIALVAAIPALMGVEHAVAPTPRVAPVTTSVMVDAPPEVVWPHVIEFEALPPPTELVFRVGIAYPKHAYIHGEGPGAIRYCVFSTGSFVEPIEVWDEPNLLQFSVTDNPPPMTEWSLHGSVHPPHLDGFMEAIQGEFRLIATDDGGTELRGTTWYRHGFWPDAYWRLWSDAIIHRVHLRVLEHIRDRAEATIPAS